MPDASEWIALEVNDESVSVHDVFTLAKLTGKLQVLQDAIDATLISQEAARRDISVSVEELQQAADDFRTANDLHDAATTEQWLTDNHLSYVDWECLIEAQVMREKLVKEITGPRVEQFFAENRLSYDTAVIHRLLVPDEEVARELRAQIIEDGADFHSLARLYSLDDATKLAGGYAGAVGRNDLEAAVEAAVFGASPNTVIGPLKDADGWQLIKVESVQRASLDDSLRAIITSHLFAEWLSEQRRKARVNIPLLEPSEASDEFEEDEDNSD